VVKAQGYRVPAAAVDGMDVLAVNAAVERAAAAARGGGGPQFLEFKTYRLRSHSMFDPELYRPKAEIEEWRAREPLVTFPARLQAEPWWQPGLLDEIERAVAAEVDAAVQFAERGGWEPVGELCRFVESPRGQA
jgi:TPP-dependent pyruvate/acetoin dehydrogenase alpha subunit